MTLKGEGLTSHENISILNLNNINIYEHSLEVYLLLLLSSFIELVHQKKNHKLRSLEIIWP